MKYKDYEIQLSEFINPYEYTDQFGSEFKVRSDGMFFKADSKFGTVFGVDTERVLLDAKDMIDKALKSRDLFDFFEKDLEVEQ